MNERALPSDRARLSEIEAIDDDAADTEVYQEMMRLVWASYFATREAATPLPPLQFSLPAMAGLFPDLERRLPDLEASLGGIRVPVAVLVGEGSPMPPETAGLSTAEAIPGAWAHVEPGVGHFPWLERPGCVLPVLDRLTGRGAV
jgi:pimeloyl-ACP methyl ester carboxylesterase